MRVVIQTAPILVNSFHPTQVYLLFMRLSVWVDLIELVRHKHERSHKSFFTSPGRPTPLWAPHNHTHSLNKGSLGALNDYTKCIHKPILWQIQFSIIKRVDPTNDMHDHTLSFKKDLQ